MKKEVRGFFDPVIIDKIDEDVGKLGNSRAEVVRDIVNDYYRGNLVNAEQLGKLILKVLKKAGENK